MDTDDASDWEYITYDRSNTSLFVIPLLPLNVNSINLSNNNI